MIRGIEKAMAASIRNLFIESFVNTLDTENTIQMAWF